MAKEVSVAVTNALVGVAGIFLAGTVAAQAWIRSPGVPAAPTRPSLVRPAVVHPQPDTPSRAARAPRSTLQRAAAPADVARFSDLMQRYCLSCHNDRLKTAGLVIEPTSLENLYSSADIWERVLAKLQSGAMPPPGLPKPPAPLAEEFVGWLATSLDRVAAARPNPGRPANVHRLNRTEYANAIRDLLALDIDVRSLLPPDDTGYGFDNIADVLSVSPTLLERYLAAARKISRQAVGSVDIAPDSHAYTVHKYARQDDRMSDDLPFGSRAGLAARHHFPVDGDYTVRVRLLRTYRDEVRGLGADERLLEIRLDGKKIAEWPVGGPRSVVTLRSGVNADDALQVRIAVNAGTHTLAAAFLQRTADLVPEGMLEPILPVTSYEYAGNVGSLPGVESLDVNGPYVVRGPGSSASRQRIFVCQPQAARAEACARQILATVARRAYRRPVTDADLGPLMKLYAQGRREHPEEAEQGFTAGIEMALRKILVTPDFLFRVETDPPALGPNTPYRLSDLELASRLSFFLWSSIPDDELLAIAAEQRLHRPDVLEGQVRRMLADDRARSLITNFAGQWLQLRNLRVAAPDPQLFPEFDENLRRAFEREAELFLDSQFREDRSVVDLLTADYTFVNERLAEHYGIPHVSGSHFRRVVVPQDERRGLLGKGAILTLTSYPTRTSPVVRGKWLLENILGAPPPPPPPNVPALNESGREVKSLSIRERMEQHRSNPGCASCHRVMDPLGFALENFDAIGRWRTASEAGTPVDASGSLADGTRVDGPTTLRAALLARPEAFARTVVEKVMTYALGRGIDHADAPVIRQILRTARPDNYRWSTLIVAIVKSMPFQMRLSAPAAQNAATAGIGDL